MDNKRTVNFSVKGDSWVNSVTFAGAVIDYTGMTDETRMVKCDKTVIIEHQGVLRKLTEAEAGKMAKGYRFAATNAGHKIVSPEELQRQAKAAYAMLRMHLQ